MQFQTNISPSIRLAAKGCHVLRVLTTKPHRNSACIWCLILIFAYARHLCVYAKSASLSHCVPTKAILRTPMLASLLHGESILRQLAHVR